MQGSCLCEKYGNRPGGKKVKICFPVKEVNGLDSEVYGHFGSAPAFIVFNSENKDFAVIENQDRNHAHGMCNPLAALAGKEINSVVVGGIGGGALNKLNAAGIDVYKAQARTVTENLALFISRGLPLFQPGHNCGGHGGGCAH
jgi:predicted Fe-Mo cluster-binding NifX family protein